MPRLRLVIVIPLLVLSVSTGVSHAQPWAPGIVPPGATSPVGVPPPPRIPFTLTEKEQGDLEVLLKAWEHHSGQIQTFAAEFTKFEYDATWAKAPPPGQAPNFLTHTFEGEVKFAKPDKGLFHITKMDKKPADDGEYWVCDGKAIYSKDYRTKTVKEFRLPLELQGKAISDGPMPFVFGVEAEKMKARYWLRIITPGEVKGQVWVEAFPKHLRDAENFRKIEVILGDKDLTPVALKVFKPNDASPQFTVADAYALRDIKKNSMIDRFRDFVTGNFVGPPTPIGWKRVVEDPAAATATAPDINLPQKAERPLTLPPRR
ncbi:MAG TPA: TIGR03009 domain-containing protein [Pirellulales bacterium]|jgi:TIGR03009 family protein|nr:TIGR03009 domain-containing protein [Pirellulales bacterium]